MEDLLGSCGFDGERRGFSAGKKRTIEKKLRELQESGGNTRLHQTPTPHANTTPHGLTV